MKHLTRILILLAVVALPAAAFAANSPAPATKPKPYKPNPNTPPPNPLPKQWTLPKGPKPWVTDSCTTESFKPAAITFSCADNNNFLDNLQWNKWNTIEAIGSGLNEHNDCNPDCASGTFTSFRVKVVMWFAKPCAGEPHKVFTRLQLTYLAGRPPGAADRYNLGCPGAS